MKKILFPTDFSKTAENAFLYALNFAKVFNADILVLNSYELPVLSTTNVGQPELLTEVYNTIELNGFEEFKKQATLLRKLAEDSGYSNVNLTFHYEEGLLPSIIHLLLDKEPFDMIVMGTIGNYSLENKIFGSNTYHVIKNVSIPVLTVPAENEFTKIMQFGFATTLKESDKKRLYDLIDLANTLGAKVSCLHVVESDDLDYKPVLDEWISEFTPLNVPFHTYEDDNLELALYNFIDDHGIDVICVLTRQLNFLEKIFTTSLTKKLAYHSRIPVLVIKEAN